jgi:uncharacterized protein (DUF924 family)
MTEIDDILGFWFARPGEAGYGERREVWWKSTPEFDAEIGARFADACERAAAGELAHWAKDARGCLALILLFDQFPRNLYRGTPRAFATDARALALAKDGIARSFDQEMTLLERIFFYTPFEHNEDLEDQRRGAALFQTLGDDPSVRESIRLAKRHLEIIERFGRFPHRNAILGRASTAEEAAFLSEPESSF